MKKALLIFSIAIFALAGCSSDKKESSKSSLKSEFKENQLEMLTGLDDSIDEDTKKSYIDYIDCYADAIFKVLPTETIEKFKNIDAETNIDDLDKFLSSDEQKEIGEAATGCASKLYE